MSGAVPVLGLGCKSTGGASAVLWIRCRRAGGDFNLDLRILQLQSVHGVDELEIRRLQVVTILQDLHEIP